VNRLRETVVQEVRAEVQRTRDRAVNEARRLVLDAEEHVDRLVLAARDLGRARGAAADRAVRREAEDEVLKVRHGAFDALLERFLVRVRHALEDLPKGDRYVAALAGWASQAARSMDRPADVWCSKRDRQTVFETLLAAGAEDFRVHADSAVHVGFVVRDLDGRTVHDARPEAIVAARREELRALLLRWAPEFPALAPA
jgi:vacuolar-type H+-ATPase subunit E/Vma4